MSNQNIKWLYKELPKLISESVLTDEDAKKLKNYYGNVEETNGLKIAFAIFGTIGAILIGAGIILLLAKNWYELPHYIRTILSFIPLLAGQIMCGYTLLKRKASTAWCEATSSFLFLAFGASISLISQTYNISGNFPTFMLVWSLSTLPIVYILSASTPAIMYLAGITTWLVATREEGGFYSLYWILLALFIPHLISCLKKDKYSVRSSFLLLFSSIALCFGIGLTMHNELTWTWIMLYSGLFSAMFLSGNTWFSDSPNIWHNPLRSFGIFGIVVLSMIFSFEWIWADSTRHIEITDWKGYLSLIPLIALNLFSIYTLIQTTKKSALYQLIYGIFGIIAILSYFASLFIDPGVGMLIMNVYILVLGISTVVKGINEKLVGLTNKGMLILSFLIVFRFFDSNLEFLIKGISFILVGIGFLVANYTLWKRKKGENI